MKRMRIRSKAAAAVATALLALGMGVLSASPASAAPTGCPSGAACIYGGPNASGGVTNQYWSRGVHRLYNQFGVHTVFNNQTDGWKFKLCKGSNGTNCDWTFYQGAWWDVDLTPYNSVIVTP
ncbi:hypothetical protein [Streptomyces sp. NBC_00878]|uniref:hypothetical protein n=1 Tax=Streptomyces sp. NBC_00878 TaxID=2975854 RepID=UPI002252E985|nr:hypothetical protein [Streptomyces sp. NBC_00878]MCX4908510.1 hypothetical protein [Streptomyces sp. NBC_00878]